ncbi:MAG: hypothetical protein L0Z49_12110 [Actinobacteria bacterium]|nr:hypothetical protein [Actinomycetota bacterium]
MAKYALAYVALLLAALLAGFYLWAGGGIWWSDDPRMVVDRGFETGGAVVFPEEPRITAVVEPDLDLDVVDANGGETVHPSSYCFQTGNFQECADVFGPDLGATS